MRLPIWYAIVSLAMKRNMVNKIKNVKNDNETIKCSLFDDITECKFNHPCDDCSRLIRHEEL